MDRLGHMIIMDQIVSNIQGYNRDSGQNHRIGGWGGVHLFCYHFWTTYSSISLGRAGGGAWIWNIYSKSISNINDIVWFNSMYHFLGKEMGMQAVLTSESHTSQVIASWEDTWCSIWCGNPGFVDPFTRNFHCLYGVYTSLDDWKYYIPLWESLSTNK